MGLSKSVSGFSLLKQSSYFAAGLAGVHGSARVSLKKAILFG
jgi:hypothetical protein